MLKIVEEFWVDREEIPGQNFASENVQINDKYFMYQ